ncbi:MAG: hypothetical protein R2705_23025 [Ilumatobacteraceae bacterium]
MNFGGREKLGESLTANGYKFGSILAQLTPGPVAQSLSQFAGVAASPALKDKREIFGRHLLRVDPTMSPAAASAKTQQAFRVVRPLLGRELPVAEPVERDRRTGLRGGWLPAHPRRASRPATG